MPIGIGGPGGGGGGGGSSKVADAFIGLRLDVGIIILQLQYIQGMMLKQLEQGANRAGNAAGKKFSQSFGSSVRRSISNVGSSIASSLKYATTAIMASATAFAGWGIKVAAEMEQAEITMQVLLKDAKKGTKLFEDIRTFAEETPFEFPELRDAAKNLLAYGVSADKVMPTLRRLGDISGGTGENVASLAETFGRFKTQGRVYANDIKEITRLGIPLKEILADQFGVKVEQMTDIIKKGKVGFPEVEKAFNTMTDKGGLFHGLTERLSVSVGGQLNKLHDAVRKAAEEIGKGLVPAVEAFTEFFLSIMPQLSQFGGWIASHFTPDRLFSWAENIAKFASEIITVFDLTAAVFKQLAGVTAQLAVSIIDFKAWVDDKVDAVNPFTTDEERQAHRKSNDQMKKPFMGLAKLGTSLDENGNIQTEVGRAWRDGQKRYDAIGSFFGEARQNYAEFKQRKRDTLAGHEPTWFDKVRDKTAAFGRSLWGQFGGAAKNTAESAAMAAAAAAMKVSSGPGLDLESLKKKKEPKQAVLAGGSMGFEDLHRNIQSSLMAQATDKKIEKNTAKSNDLLKVVGDKLGKVVLNTSNWSVFVP